MSVLGVTTLIGVPTRARVRRIEGVETGTPSVEEASLRTAREDIVVGSRANVPHVQLRCKATKESLEEDNAFLIIENQDTNENEDMLEDGGHEAEANIYIVDVSDEEVERDLQSLKYCR